MVEAAKSSTIRRATAEDLPRMEDAAREFYASSSALRDFDISRFRSLWQDLLRLGAGAVFIQENEGRLIGALGGLVHQSIYGHELIVEEFFWFVSPDERGEGLRLYRAFEEWAREKGAAWIQMVHLSDLMPEKVAHFYERMGYRPIETRYEKRLT